MTITIWATALGFTIWFDDDREPEYIPCHNEEELKQLLELYMSQGAELE